jgi:hypothetical protein
MVAVAVEVQELVQHQQVTLERHLEHQERLA